MKILITSALPYVNNIPHLGNIIGCVLPADILARYYRQHNHEVLYICGADEYGTCTETKALEEGMTPREICNKYLEIHKNIYKWFLIDFDYFGRTSTNNPKNDDWLHTKIAQDIFIKLANNNCLYEQEISQLYCNEISKFIADRFIIGECPTCHSQSARGDQCDHCGAVYDATELINPLYKYNPDYKLVTKKSWQLFLNIPKLEPLLIKWYDSVKHNWSTCARNITDNWFKIGLKGRCITRDLQWGTPVPETTQFGKKYCNKVMYNWFDAPIGYISITASFTDKWKEWWFGNDVKLIQTQSKDNVPFHSIIFPASLIGTKDNYNLVSNLAACYYLMYEDRKFSKSNNIGIFGDQVMNIGISPDIWRYFLASQSPETKDTSFKWNTFMSVINGNLNDNIGNFINRALTFTYNKFNKIVPDIDIITENDYYLIDNINSECYFYNKFMEEEKIRSALKCIVKISNLANKYLQEQQPWVIIKSNHSHCKTVIHICIHIVALLSRLLSPYMPLTSNKICSFLNYKYDIDILQLNKIKTQLNKPTILFNKINNDQINKFKTLFN